jgi:hypothetical protein
MTSQLTERRDVSALPGGRGRGPGGQPKGLPLRIGRCPIPDCSDQTDPTRLMCRRDWYQVPKRFRDQVWRTWHSGHEADSHAHQQAVLQAIAAARLARLPVWRNQILWFPDATQGWTKSLTRFSRQPGIQRHGGADRR